MKRPHFLAILAILGVVSTWSCGGKDPVAPVVVGSVSLSHQTAVIVPGATLTLVATVRDTAGLTITRTVSWSTSDNSRAGVTSGGVVSGVAAGSATITATIEGHSAQLQITIKEGGVIGVAGGSITALGGRVQLIVPQGAVSSPVMVTVEEGTSPPADVRLLPGSAIELGPTGQTFTAPVQLRMRYELSQLPPGASEQQLRIHRAAGGAWQLVSGGQADAGTRTVTASLTSFSQYAILSGQPPAIALSTASLNFTATQGGANPASQFLNVTNSGAGILSGLTVGNVVYGPGASGWLQPPDLSTTTANPSSTLTVQPITGALAGGTYTATIPILSSVATNSPQNVTVTFTVTSGPDLVLDVMTAPAAGAIGSTISVLTTVRNQGTAAAGPFRVGFYYSLDATITTADVFSGFACTYAAGLAVNTMSDCSGPIPVPASLPPGTYVVGAIADDLLQSAEINESNNTRAATNTTTLAVLPDLVLDVVTAPASGATGGTIPVSATVRNQGTVGTTVFRVAFYYSTDATITTSDFFSGAACTYASGLPANSFSNCAGSIPVPSALPPGTYFVGAIADDIAQVNESNEGNNSRAAATTTVISNLPDFVIDVVTAPSLGLVGGTISVSATLRNQGSATTAAFRVGLYYSTDATITTADTFSGAACMYATGLAANSTSDCAGPIPVPGSLPPGTYFVGAIADDNLLITEISESNNARAASTTTVVSVVAPPLNLLIDGMYLIQATQNYAGNVPLIAGRDAFLRVFVKATDANSATPAVRVRFYQSGMLVDTRTIAAAAGQVPTTIAEGVLTSSWNVAVAGSLIQPELSILADVDPTNAIAESDESDNAFPVSGTPGSADVRMMPALNITLVPVMQSVNGLTGNVSVANQSTFLNLTTKLWPVSGVSAIVHDVYTTMQPVLQSDDANGSWGNLLGELNALRMMEGTSRQYYGVLKVSYTSGIAGLGYIGLPASIGWDHLPSGDEVTAHELGHNFERRHSPCGDPSGLQPGYPYEQGNIGVYGYDNAAALLKAPSMADIMSYCSPPWISDFTYTAALDFIAANPTAPIISQPVPGLLIWGRIENGRLILEPSLDIVARPTPPRASGPYRIEATDAAGRTVLSFAFAPDIVADAPVPTQHFAFVVPRSAFGAQEVSALRLTGPLGFSTNVRSSVPASAMATPAAEPIVRRRAANVVDMTWDSQRYPLAVVRSATTGAVLSIARGGVVSVRSIAGEVDVVFSDGVKSVTRRLRVIQ